MLVENGRVVIVSPHLDDAVLSLGGWIATASKQGAAVKVVTVMAGDPKKDLPASKWDLRCGFEGQIQATEARRKEDAAACGVVGAAHEWLPFMNGVYQLPETDDVWAALEPHLAWADFALLPGCPLRHPDHHLVTSLVLERATSQPQLGFYLEEPYAVRQGIAGFSLPEGDEFATVGTLAPSALPYSREIRTVKAKACRSYASQLRPLSRRYPFVIRRLLSYESARGGETVAWLSRSENEITARARRRSTAARDSRVPLVGGPTREES